MRLLAAFRHAKSQIRAPRRTTVKRTAKLLVAAVLALAGAALAFAGTAPKQLSTVSDVVAKPPGTAVELRGTVKAGSLDRNATPATFVVTDGAADLLVRWSKPLPSGSEGASLDGRAVVVRGTIVAAPGGRALDATDLQVGCASKYQQS
jgi:cytochrome c-type biogenesis protein CcmE